MKKRILNVFFIASIAMGAVACKDKTNEVEATEAEEAAVASTEAVQFTIDTTSSVMKWRGTKPTGEHIGTVDIQSGTITARDGEVESGNVMIDMNSIEVTDAEMKDEDRRSLEDHLKGTVEGKETDFFNVREYPTASFEVTGTTERDGKTFLQGNLTLKDATKNVEFPVTTRMSEDGTELTLESEPFNINRTDWGVNYGSKSVFDDLGDNFISDDMEIQIMVKANRA